MKTLMQRLAPGATDMIRADHARVLTVFHRYHLDSRPAARKAIAETICLALEIHARMEEEVFYPAMREAGSTLLDKFVPEHEEMRSLIAQLRGLDPASELFDATFMELMRAVIHHVADEETAMLPHAESVLAPRLKEIGAQMAKRRLQLAAPQAGAMVRRSATASPVNAMMAAAALIAGIVLFRRTRRTD
jgi:hemerythrin superfamily protein